MKVPSENRRSQDLDVAVLRSTSLKYDSRAQRIFQVLRSLGVNWLGFGIARKNVDLGELSKISEYRLMFSDTYHGSGLRNIASYLRWNIWIWRQLKLQEIALLYMCDVDSLLAVALLKFQKPKTKIILDIFDPIESRPIPRVLRGLFSQIEKMAVQISNDLILPSYERGATLVQDYCFTVVNNWPTVEFDSADVLERTNHKEANKILYAGLLSAERGVEFFLDTIVRHSKWNLTIAGYGPLEGIVKDYSNEFPERVKFLGMIDHDKVLYESCSACAILAIYDPKVSNSQQLASNKYYEALRCEVPLLANIESAIGRTVCEQEIGWTFQFENVESLAATLEQMELEYTSHMEVMKPRFADLRREEEENSAARKLPQLIQNKLGTT
jgi:glycosyltransferase involved in cell wall biosynthesis